MLDRGSDAIAEVVDSLCRRRTELLRADPPGTHGTIPEGRVLLTTAIAESVVDGATSDASGGWFDLHDLPPWDTWFAYARLSNRAFTERHTLVAFVPRDWEVPVTRGIEVNPVSCIEWACDADLSALGLAQPV